MLLIVSWQPSNLFWNCLFFLVTTRLPFYFDPKVLIKKHPFQKEKQQQTSSFYIQRRSHTAMSFKTLSLYIFLLWLCGINNVFAPLTHFSSAFQICLRPPLRMINSFCHTHRIIDNKNSCDFSLNIKFLCAKTHKISQLVRRANVVRLNSNVYFLLLLPHSL